MSQSSSTVMSLTLLLMFVGCKQAEKVDPALPPLPPSAPVEEPVNEEEVAIAKAILEFEELLKLHELRGTASWYGRGFHGKKTACGEPFDKKSFTAAHRTLPFHSVVRVHDTQTRKSVVVRINDRGPYKLGRVIDLSRAAAEDLDIVSRGKAKVRLEVLEIGDGATCQ